MASSTLLKLLPYENELFLEMFHENSLLVLCEGLGLERILLHFLRLYCDLNELVLVLNTDRNQQEYFIEQLKLMGIVKLPTVVTSECGVNERKKMYASGGVFFSSSRIFVMDFLVDRLPVHLVSGILVNKAHNMSTSYLESFIMRLYRQKNKEGFIKAFTDNPVALASGFSNLEKVMKNLFVGHVLLWPRFHKTILESLEQHKPEVIEIEVEMTSSMREIQNHILEIVSACLRELKSTNPGLEAEELTVENSLGRSFDRSVRSQLDPVWNELGWKTKRLVADLRMLRLLLLTLSQYDCVTFLRMLETSAGGEKEFGKNPGWILLDAADNLFMKSRRRVFGDTRSKKKDTGKKEKDGGKSEKAPLLEACPKWKILQEVLDEVKEANDETANTPLGVGKTLICCADMRSVYMLRDVLRDGGDQTLLRLFRKTFSKTLPPAAEKATSSKDKKGTKARKKATTSTTTDDDDGDTRLATNADDDDDGSCMLKVDDHTHLHALHGNPDPYSLTRALDHLQPRYVVLYDSSVHFVRQLEVYKACRPPGTPVRVYFLTYRSSTEEQIYLTSLRREKDAFKQLIRDKATMVVPKEREGLRDGDIQNDVTSAYQLPVDTRNAGGQRPKVTQEKLVVVDMREFRSELPSLLHKRGINIAPLTIEVGDYILTPEMCVERKSLSDLIGSLNSGRLYSQCVSMSRHYKKPVLLIEFDADKAFSFKARGATRHMQLKELNQKLTLLLLHFPTLRLAWCSSPAAAAKLFDSLKLNRDEPDPAIAATIGGGDDSLDSEEKYNHASYDFLLKLPGINAKNCRRILHHVTDLAELCQLSEAQLAKLLDSQVNAQLLHSFLHRKYESDGPGSNPAPTAGNSKPSKRPFANRTSAKPKSSKR